MALRAREERTFANIISDGTIRVKAQEGDPLAVRRDIKLPDGTEMTKFERVYHELSGFIHYISFKEGDYGKQLIIAIKDGDFNINLSMSMQSNYAEDLLKKLPNVDVNKEIVLSPYSFEDDKKKLRRGVTVMQDGEKLKSYFHDEKNNPINGFVEFEKDWKTYDKEDWKMHFIKTRKFLQQFTEEKIIPLLDFKNDDTQFEPAPDENDIKLENVEFVEPAAPVETVPSQEKMV